MSRRTTTSYPIRRKVVTPLSLPMDHPWDSKGAAFYSFRPFQQLSSTRLHGTAATSISNIQNHDPPSSSSSSTNDKVDELLDPYDILRKMKNLSNTNETPPIPFPTHFSPTSLEQFLKCPQAFFFMYILKLTPDPPMTPELARGILCHTALEEIYDLSPADRNLTNLENLFRRAWKKVRGERDSLLPKNVEEISNSNEKTQYNVLFRKHDDNEERISAMYDIESEIDWGESSLRLLKNYMELEDPRNYSPLMREMWVHARFPLTDNYSNESHADEDFIIKGKIDRIDILPSTSSNRIHLQIIDYKTGKKPWFKYSQSVNDRILKENFWKMKVYALVLWKMIHQTENDVATSDDNEVRGQQKDLYKYFLSWEIQQRLKNAMDLVQIKDTKWSNVLALKSLRLIHLTSHLDDDSVNNPTESKKDISIVGKASYLDYALDAPSAFESVILDQTEREVQTLVREVKVLVETQSPHAFKHCDWRYCSCHEFRRRFRPGSVYVSPDAHSQQYSIKQ